jgi:endonuclease/exonuclease/phosphatase family metal-dependent hydrolase
MAVANRLPLLWNAGMMLRVLIVNVLLCLVAAAEEDAVPGFRFCCYNVKNWLMMDRTYGESPAPLKPKPQKEKEAIISTLHKIQPDVLGLCEVGTDEDVKEIQSMLAKADIDLPHTERCHGRDGTRSLALLSRYPIVDRLSHTDLPYKIGNLDLGVQRGVLHAVIEPQPGFRVHLMGVHLKSQRTVPEADEAVMRRNEFILLRRIIDATLDVEPGAKILCYGDFNEHRGEAAFVDFLGNRSQKDRLLYDVYLKDANGEVWTHFWDMMDTYSRLDYCVVSPGLKPFIESRKSFIFTDRNFDDASDHRPLMVKVSYGDAAARAKAK